MTTEVAPANTESSEAEERHVQSDRLLPATISFLCKNAWLVTGISLLVLIPCFWHKHIEACDLGSHLYNAWLVTLIGQGQAPGLYVVPQWNNVLFDILLTRLGSLAGWNAAEKIAVSAAVLIFFWGAFALITAASRRPPWLLCPAIAMVTYGWTFHIGFFNFYLSLGLAFWSLTLLWRGKGWDQSIGFALMPIVFAAHPLGAVWLIASVLYIKSAGALPALWRPLLLPAAAVVLALASTYFSHHYETQTIPLNIYLLNGIDQVILGLRYRVLGRVALLFAAGSLVLDAIGRGRNAAYWVNLWLPLELYGVSLLARILLPDQVVLPRYALPLSFLVWRLTSVCAVLALCVLGCMRLTKWHLTALAVAATWFFSLLYQDTATLARMEAQSEQLVGALPPRQRVVATIHGLPGSRFFFINHLVDRACIERCFSYSNYEASSGQFRVRAQAGSSVVAATAEAVDEMQLGVYTVQPSDLPLFQIYQCAVNGTKLCMRELHAGEKNGLPDQHLNEKR